MSTEKDTSDFYREYDLTKERKHGATKSPAPFQQAALTELSKWYQSKSSGARGGILVLPTGGGKTFTASHFICGHPIKDGFKVLWLAHTHHLLEQAFYSFESSVGLVAEPKAKLNVRVVSGTIGHFPVHTIKATDDVVVSSLPTMVNAVKSEHRQLESFLNSAKEKLFVVFDEAHHSPAPSYRRLIEQLQTRVPQMQLLGLTATPTYGEEKKRGWLTRLFPQGIIHQESPHNLMASGILARPVPVELPTDFEPDFDESEYEKWISTYRDLPESIIDSLASSRSRNEYIASHYAAERKKYGKTIIFADRWAQCEQLSEALKQRGVRAGAIYSHVDADPGTVSGRQRRKSDENAQVLKKFRANELDVLINIRMATEGTDVPDVQTVFLTRQTTSQILLTQMIGRALRGPKFGGTDRAYIVSFIDNWKHKINWAAYDQLASGLADETIPEYGTRPPLQLISIELVRRLAHLMDSGVNVNPAPFKTFLPIGWYRTEYFARVQDRDTDDVESVGQLVMVFEGETPAFESFMAGLKKSDLVTFESDSLLLADVKDRLDALKAKHFSEVDDRIGGGFAEDLFAIARHIAQSGTPPKFFEFDLRDDHDLDSVAQQHLDEGLNDRDKVAALKHEYSRTDRYWKVIYFSFANFKSHYDACINRILDADELGQDPGTHTPVFSTPESIPDREPTEELKNRVKSRDRYQCLCCGYSAKKSQLQVDHIAPAYHGGINHMDNLQTLCKTCNGPAGKGIEAISFRSHHTTLTASPAKLRVPTMPAGTQAGDASVWEMYLRRLVNLFYRCAAVESIEIGSRGEKFYRWRVVLYPDNDPKWFEQHRKDLVLKIRDARQRAGYQAAPDYIEVTN